MQEIIEQEKELKTNDYVIVRTYSAGVFAGNLLGREGQEVRLVNARRLWQWYGAASLSQLAVDGIKEGFALKCKFPVEVPLIELTQAIEIIKCSKLAEESIKKVPIWEA